jgi:hypothetical protein
MAHLLVAISLLVAAPPGSKVLSWFNEPEQNGRGRPDSEFPLVRAVVKQMKLTPLVAPSGDGGHPGKNAL